MCVCVCVCVCVCENEQEYSNQDRLLLGTTENLCAVLQDIRYSTIAQMLTAYTATKHVYCYLRNCVYCMYCVYKC